MSKQFKVGDTVKLKGYTGRLFEVVWIKEVLEYLNGDVHVEIRYKLRDIHTKEEMIGFAEDMQLYRDEEKHKMTIDSFLDLYCDYMALYQMFGDDRYKTMAINYLDTLRRYVKE